jgi:hypothetical protein
MDSWVEDVQEGDVGYFGSTANGWTNKTAGMNWLKNVFEPNTRPKSTRTWRMLIVDGHSSHVNLEFLDWAVSHQICVLILPPHATHRLQPCDVNFFGPLGNKYQEELDNILLRSLRCISMTKRMFYGVFNKAWNAVLTPERYRAAFEGTGIWPYKPERIMKTINSQRPKTPSKASQGSSKPLQPLKTPMTSKAIRKLQRQYKSNPSPAKLDLIFRSQLRLAAEHSIGEHTRTGLLESLKNEKKRRKRGKKLNLCGEEDTGTQLFSVQEILKARAITKEKEDFKELERVRKATKKVQQAQNKQLKEVEAKKKEEEKAQAKANKQLAQDLEQVAKKHAPRQAGRGKKKSLIVILSVRFDPDSQLRSVRVTEDVVVVRSQEGSCMRRRPGRQISLPTSFRD